MLSNSRYKRKKPAFGKRQFVEAVLFCKERGIENFSLLSLSVLVFLSMYVSICHSVVDYFS